MTDSALPAEMGLGVVAAGRALEREVVESSAMLIERLFMASLKVGKKEERSAKKKRRESKVDLSVARALCRGVNFEGQKSDGVPG